MIDKLLGKMVFNDSAILTVEEQNLESRLEETHLDLFVYTSPAKNAKGIGAHLGSFSRNHYPLPCYLSLIEDWLDNYYDVLLTDKKYKNFKQYPHDDFTVYLVHKVFICKVVRGEVFSTNPSILTSVNHIKSVQEAHTVVGKAKKYLDEQLNPYALSGTDFTAITQRINQAKGEA